MATKYIVNNLTGQTINGQQVQPYKVYTALLTQSGTSSVNSITTGDLTIGVTYQIVLDEGGTGWDFTNVGAPNNDVDTYFVATGTTPSSWGTGGMLNYDTGVPVVTVLENTIGYIWFRYSGVGYYFANLVNGFPYNKTTVFIQGQRVSNNLDYIEIVTTDPKGTINNDVLDYTPIEIRVYN